MLLIVAGIASSLAGALFAISITGRPDLSDLVPIGNSASSYSMPLFVGAPVQALGYLFESHRARSEGEWLQDFVLLPGTFRASAGDPAGSKPLYTLELARVHPAGSEEIRQYFK